MALQIPEIRIYTPVAYADDGYITPARAVAYADDGYIKGKLSDVLQVLAELKRVLKEDAGLDLNISKTAVLSKAITQQALFDVAHAFIDKSPQLTQLSGELSLDSFHYRGRREVRCY